MGLHWADRANSSWQHFKDHLTGPQRGTVVGIGIVCLWTALLRCSFFQFFVLWTVVLCSDEYCEDKKKSPEDVTREKIYFPVIRKT